MKVLEGLTESRVRRTITGARTSFFRDVGDDPTVHLLVALGAVVVGASLAEDRQLRSLNLWTGVLLLLLLLAYVAIALTIEPEILFATWLFAAPFLQGSAQQTALGKELARILYELPPLLLVVVLLFRGRARKPTTIDFLPGLFLLYVFVSSRLINSEPFLFGSGLRQIYVVFGIGVAAYYFIVFGPTTTRLGQRFAAALVGSGIALAAMTIVEGLTGWNLWHDTTWRHAGGLTRAVATLSNPAALGTFLGIAVAVAAAILLWDGPVTLKKPSKVFLILALPALFFTYTRGPMLAAVVVAVATFVLARRARWPSVGVLVATSLALLAFAGAIGSTSLFHTRFENTTNVQTRLLLQKESLKLAEQRPIVGWGYGSYDRVKSAANGIACGNSCVGSLQSTGTPTVVSTTSHNSFLTTLVELGGVGLVLLLAPWSIIFVRALGAARRAESERWLFAGVVGALVVYVISVSTYDVRFFSLMSCLPWILLGIARRALADRELRSGSR
jgi:O-antigen ligase